MGHNDPLVDAVEEAGVRTWSTAEMAANLLSVCTPEQRAQAADAPVVADFTGGLDPDAIDLKALAAAAQGRGRRRACRRRDRTEADTVAALPAPARARASMRPGGGRSTPSPGTSW